MKVNYDMASKLISNNTQVVKTVLIPKCTT